MSRLLIPKLSVAVTLTLAVLAPSPAAAGAATGAYAGFAECPTTVPGVESCFTARLEGGEITIGKQVVPITKTIVLQGGYIENPITGHETTVAAINGETLTRAPQTVPGGLAGLFRCDEIRVIQLRTACAMGNSTVTATTELAVPAEQVRWYFGKLLEREGTGLSLPVKVKLENKLLGNNCYIGSNTNPLVLNLTTGTTNPPPPTKPITGSVGAFHASEEGAIITLNPSTLLDNTFTAPTATGCSGSLAPIIDAIIDSKLDLPSPAGHNTAILTATYTEANSKAVHEHDD